MRGEKLYGKRREGIVAGVVNVIIFQIPLTDDNVVFERRAGEAMNLRLVGNDSNPISFPVTIILLHTARRSRSQT